MRVADLRERIRRDLERRGVKVRPKKELARVIGCACGYQGFALRGTLFFWRCPQCGRRAKHDLACYDLPVKAAELFILERERLARSRRWVRIVVPLLVTALAIAAIVGGVFLLGLQFSVSTASEYKDFLAIKNRLHTQIVSEESLRIRLDAVREAILYGPNGRELLIADLAGQRALVRQAIEKALTNAHLTDLPALEAALMEIPPDDMEIALCFVRIFGRIGKPALASLQQGLGHSRPMVRFAAAKAMVAAGANPDEMLPALKELAAGDDKEKTSDLISVEAIKSLGDIGRPALTALTDLLRSERRGDRRVAVVTAIGSIQPPGKDIADHLAPALDDEAASVRSRATQMLSRQGAVAFDVLSRLATEGAANKDVRLFAIRSLGTMGDNRAVPLLCQAVQNAKEVEVRKYAAESLGAIGDARATQTLCQALVGDKATDVRQAAAKSLGGIGNAGLFPMLCAASVNDTSPDVQISAAGSLVAIAVKSGGVPDPAIIPALSRALLGHSDPIVRRRAADRLGATTDPRAVAPLRSALFGDADRDIRKSAAENLGKLRTKNAAEALYQGLLSDLDVSVREAIAKGLVATTDPQAIPSLGKILADERYANLHERVAESLGLMGDPAGLAVLSAALLQNGNPKVRETVARSMGLIGDPSAISALQSAAAGDQSQEVKEAARQALLAIRSKPSTTAPAAPIGPAK
jgi:HEAT repeat protein